MDPDANLEAQLRMAKRFIDNQEYGDEPDPADVAHLAELVLALDEWLMKGGFPPKKWKTAYSPRS